MKRLLLVLLLAACGGDDPVADLADRARRRTEAAGLIDGLDRPAILERVVALGEIAPVVRATGIEYPEAVRCAACTALGRIGGAAEQLEELTHDESRWVRRFAAAALAGEPAPHDELLREREAERLLAKPIGRADIRRVVELGAVFPVIRATLHGPNRSLACLALGLLGGMEARPTLSGIETDSRRIRLHAREGLRLLDEPDLDAAFNRIDARLAVEKEGQGYADILANPDAVDQVVKLGAVWVLIDATRPDKPKRMRHNAAVGLGKVGGPEARDRLLELVQNNEGDPEIDGPIRLYAAVGLTLLKDPGTAVDLLLALSRINPNDNIAVRAEEGQQGAYFTIDAQICDALLGLGLWEAEEELIEQMRRRHYIRVLIDAHAVLRRRTGIKLPFRYNGSYADRNADIAAWEKELRRTRATRYAQTPFAADNARFRMRFQEQLDWLEGRSVNNRYIARKVVRRVGFYAIPELLAMLKRDNPIGQREAARMLGLIGVRTDALIEALSLADAHARGNAVASLRALGDTSARSEVQALLADPDAAVRAEAARYLGALGGDQASLRTALATERAPATRTAMLCALLRQGDKSVIPELEKVAAEGEQHDREAAKAALAEGKGK